MAAVKAKKEEVMDPDLLPMSHVAISGGPHSEEFGFGCALRRIKFQYWKILLLLGHA